jgi:hypothetical protein
MAPGHVTDVTVQETGQVRPWYVTRYTLLVNWLVSLVHVLNDRKGHWIASYNMKQRGCVDVNWTELAHDRVGPSDSDTRQSVGVCFHLLLVYLCSERRGMRGSGKNLTTVTFFQVIPSTGKKMLAQNIIDAYTTLYVPPKVALSAD